jgi:hypothetical protein
MVIPLWLYAVVVVAPESPGQYHAWLHTAADQIRTLEAQP